MQNPSNIVSGKPLKLLDQVRDKIRLKYHSFRAKHAYKDWIKRYILHFGKHHPS